MVAIAVIAVGVIVWNVKDSYFTWDEWAYWNVRRPMVYDGDLLGFVNTPHNGHWHGLVMTVWAPLDVAFGATSYLPYVVPTILVHILAGLLLFRLLRYAGLHPNVALGAAVLYLVSASAAGNTSMGWQIGFTAPIALTYAGMLGIVRVEDEKRPQVLVLVAAAGLIAVFSSGVGITTVVVIAVAAALRRQFGAAAWIGGIPAVVYGVWRVSFNVDGSPISLSRWSDYLGFAQRGVIEAARQLVQIGPSFFGWLVVLLITIGIVAGFLRRDPHMWVFAAPLVGVVFFYVTLATQRAGLEPGAFSPLVDRYVHVTVALLLPAFALTVDQMVRRVPPSAVIGVLVVFLWSLALNLSGFLQENDQSDLIAQRIRAEVAATVALGDQLFQVENPGSVEPYGREAFHLTLQTVQVLGDAGKFPCDASDTVTALDMATRLGIKFDPPLRLTCDR